MKRWYFTLLCLPLLYACGKPAADDYFPLDKGLHWAYQVTITQPHRADSKTLTIENVATESVQDTPTTVRRTSDGTDYYIARQQDGLYRIAKRSVVELVPQRDEMPRMVLPATVRQAIGKTWSNVSMPYLIERVFEGNDEITAGSLRFPMTYTLTSVNETVSVPAGTFTQCVLVEGQTDLSLYTDVRKGHSLVPITTREWYAPGVGLVKLVRDEPLDTDIYKGGTMTLELTQFTD